MIRKAMMVPLVFLNWLLIYSCNMMDSGKPLPGKILVSKSQEHVCLLYENSDVAKFAFKERNDEEVNNSVMSWLNTKDNFIGTQTISGLTRNEYKCNIMQFDLSGRPIERIYEALSGEIAWPEYASWDDRYLLFTTHRNVDPEQYPFEGLSPMLSLLIMDLEQKKVIARIDSIGRDPNFKIEESPWLHKGYRFVYSIDSKAQLKLQSDEKIINPVAASEGVYIFDITSGESKLLVHGGRSAIASPTTSQIAYVKDNSIRVLDLNTNEETTIYKYSSKEQLFGKHWTPDGKHIYFAYKYHLGIGDLFNTGEKLIEVSEGKEKPFNMIGHGFQPYTWK